jgi:hypothetical protein
MERKRAKVYRLPTNEKSNLFISSRTKDLRTHFKGNSPNNVKSYYHLYITSYDEIKEGDKPCWCYNSIKNTWNEDIIYYQGAMPMYHFKGFKKIIATTDTSLIALYGIDEEGFGKMRNGLPQPSQTFIEKYCKLGGIDEVDVEYEYGYSLKMRRGNTEHFYKLKVDSHNTITIHAIKDSWSRDEYEKGLRDAFKAGISFTGPSFYGINTELQKYEDKWIEDNL